MRNTHDIYIQKLRQRHVVSPVLPKNAEIQVVKTDKRNVSFKIVECASGTESKGCTSAVTVKKEEPDGGYEATPPVRVLNFEHGIFGNVDTELRYFWVQHFAFQLIYSKAFF